MSLSVHGLAISRGLGSGIAIGRAVRVLSSKAGVAHYFIKPAQVNDEVQRVREARNAVVDDMQRLQLSLSEHAHKDAPHELAAIMDVHLMLLQDETLADGVRQFIEERHYNAEWALCAQLEVIAAQFDDMHDPYMRERKGDLEQVVERVLQELADTEQVMTQKLADAESGEPLVLIAHDLSPADMVRFKTGVFKGFVTDVGGKTSHTAIVARSLGIPAIVGAKSASALVRQDDAVIVDARAGVLIINPSDQILQEYKAKQAQQSSAIDFAQDTQTLSLRAPDGSAITVLANIELPSDVAAALLAGAQGIGLFRTEFLFMGRADLPGEEEQYKAYSDVVQSMKGLPVTIRTIDIGADKPLGNERTHTKALHANPALGLRAIRWCLSEPAMFLTQLRALLRAATFGRIDVLIPMLAHESEIKQTMLLVDRARTELSSKGIAYGEISVGAMIEVPAAALTVPVFLKYFDFLSVGTNDLTQYTLAVDRADETVAHLFDGAHPAVQFLLNLTIEQCIQAKKSVSVCGEMAGDPSACKALLNMGLRSFSMHPSQIHQFANAINTLQAGKNPDILLGSPSSQGL